MPENLRGDFLTHTVYTPLKTYVCGRTCARVRWRWPGRRTAPWCCRRSGARRCTASSRSWRLWTSTGTTRMRTTWSPPTAHDAPTHSSWCHRWRKHSLMDHLGDVIRPAACSLTKAHVTRPCSIIVTVIHAVTISYWGWNRSFGHFVRFPLISFSFEIN